MPKFIDEEHKQFYELKLQEIGKSDVYRKALIYILAMCETTREHFNDIFNIKDGEININSLQAPYQTGSSEKVTRMAFSLWNRCNYDSEEDIENNKPSIYYNPSEIFCCGYAPYFYEAIKLRYPEYTQYNNTIADVIELVRTKYQDNVDFNYSGEVLTLEYMYLLNNERDCYQIIEVTEFEDKLKIEFLTQHITRIIDIDDLEDIFEMLHRQSTHKLLSKEEIKVIKQKYVKGTRIKLNKMYDPFTPPPSNTIGIVDFVDDAGQIHISWNNGSSLALVVGIDDFEIIETGQGDKSES